MTQEKANRKYFSCNKSQIPTGFDASKEDQGIITFFGLKFLFLLAPINWFVSTQETLIWSVNKNIESYD